MSRLFLFLVLNSSILASAQHKKAYTIFTSTGVQIGYNAVIDSLQKKEIILFGEQHNSAISHWLQYEISKDLSKTNRLILGAEMIEADNQKVLNRYLVGEIDQKGLDTLARLWKNYKTDYKPLIDLAKNDTLPFIATNIPRNFANLVFKNGFKALDSLSVEDKSWIAPLPIVFDANLATYKNILTMMGEHGTPELVMAQAIKDATMAHFILRNYEKKHTFIHFNGAYHSDNYEGILWYLKNKNKSLKYATLSTLTQSQLDTLEIQHLGKADFIIVVDANVTTTY
ncbi:MAG: iron-regulated protein [Flavobacteriaceae bacterium CG_4_8_14_3_um_filter_34_10]|nr:ChaN family lipoprotein [Flavobacteriia bacterium]OIP49327.1 MAG: iron-regulated protein [Flavobacteriaceae bacterium CG2_30_34_30]PIQ17497.1 MAG: iron-regulated protein [Flavobacteriaceae bacterium CG18_big_fil_WC_8_21_14_2_50_34_36]PIV50253.1 MAG: iron-regulated protein [Flavobacteriaceae bacterium CG02_land_8_20_14_3_00_34_13]PIX08495.1 MAG: iron-regulated protein [Flavobacteriaceae bacterium CG_4_8_14_3_um_filter_34_10]PJC08114.1 MAG: iron-regulated protein [Flavobacteriaceae bacterium 